MRVRPFRRGKPKRSKQKAIFEFVEGPSGEEYRPGPALRRLMDQHGLAADLGSFVVMTTCATLVDPELTEGIQDSLPVPVAQGFFDDLAELVASLDEEDRSALRPLAMTMLSVAGRRLP